MKPLFSREAVVDRRQPHIRWVGIITGALIALGLWNLFNLLFLGGALTSIDPDEIDRAHTFGIGTGIGSVVAPLIAMFVGGMVAGRIAAHYDDRVSAAHGVLVWAITSVVGLVIMATVIGNLVDRRGDGRHHDMSAPPPGTSGFVEEQVRMINQHLKSQKAHTIKSNDFLDAARHAAGDGRTVDKEAFISRLATTTHLSRPEAEAVFAKLGDSAPDTIIAAQLVARHRQQMMEAAEHTGNSLLAAGVGLFLCLVTAIAGAIIGARHLGPKTPKHDTIPGQPIVHTAPYPAAPPPDVE